MTNELDFPESTRALAPTVDPTAALVAMVADPERLNRLDTDKIEALLRMMGEIQARRAKAEFNAAMSRVRSRMKPVARRGSSPVGGKTSTARHAYALADDVKAMLDPLLDAEGFTYSGSQEPGAKDGCLNYVLLVRHRGGHEERHSWYDVPRDLMGPHGTPNKSPLHAIGSTETYCLRRLLCSVFAVQLADDDDGNAGSGLGPGTEPITEAQLAQVKDAGNEARVDWERLYEHFKITALAELPAARFAEVMSLIAKKRQLQQGTKA